MSGVYSFVFVKRFLLDNLDILHKSHVYDPSLVKKNLLFIYNWKKFIIKKCSEDNAYNKEF